jgi:hypothetical protein
MRKQVIDSIEVKANTFYTKVGGNHANVAVVEGRSGTYVPPMQTENGTTTCRLYRKEPAEFRSRLV